MAAKKRPYLIVPKLVEQPTWGGDYIVNLKGWKKKKDFLAKRIGQSYELFSGTKLLVNIKNSQDERFSGELGSPDKPEIFNQTGYKKNTDYIDLKTATSFYKKIPLIKINQSNGNSFQIHIKKENDRWLPKLESCYYLEDGLVTFGVKKNTDIKAYKKACLLIEKKMNQLSSSVKNKKISIKEARRQSMEFIKRINPWQFVNTHIVKKDTVGPGVLGVQHSWEEDDRFPMGLVNYEIQQDVMDPVSTIRSFDKGKIKDDGSVREIHIEDYFKYLDTDSDHNDLKKMTPIRKGNRLLTTKYYCLDILEIKKELIDKTNGSFSHLFVKNGKVKIDCEDGSVSLSKGHSCFIPENVVAYKIKAQESNSVILKTFLEL